MYKVLQYVNICYNMAPSDNTQCDNEQREKMIGAELRHDCDVEGSQRTVIDAADT